MTRPEPSRRRAVEPEPSRGRIVVREPYGGPLATRGRPVEPRGERLAAQGRLPEQRVALVDLLDRLLAGGVVVSGDLVLSIADIDLVRISLRVLITSIRESDVIRSW